jgi:hypothetical protein
LKLYQINKKAASNLKIIMLNILDLFHIHCKILHLRNTLQDLLLKIENYDKKTFNNIELYLNKSKAK